MFEKITKENWFLFAMKHYNNPKTDGEMEIYDDMKRFKYIKRLFRKYKDTGILKERLLLNHIIILNNLFGADAASTLLIFKIEADYWPILKGFLEFLNIMPEQDLTHIDTDPLVKERLSEL